MSFLNELTIKSESEKAKSRGRLRDKSKRRKLSCYKNKVYNSYILMVKNNVVVAVVKL